MRKVNLSQGAVFAKLGQETGSSSAELTVRTNREPVSSWDFSVWERIPSQESTRVGALTEYEEAPPRWLPLRAGGAGTRLEAKQQPEIEVVEVEEYGKMPPGRSAHSLVSVGGGVLWGFGGTDAKTPRADLFRCEIAKGDSEGRVKLTWTQLEGSAAAPAPFGPRFAHSAVVVGGCMYVFSGASKYDADGSLIVTTTLAQFQFSDESWKVLETSGDEPDPRVWHSCVAHESRLFVFGGNLAGPLADLHSLDLVTMTWEALPSAPYPRDKHSAVVCRDEEGQDCMLVFGGCGAKDTAVNDLLKYRFDSRTWTSVTTGGDFVPRPRYYHGAVAVAGGAVVIVSGGKTGDEFARDILRLDTTTMTWSLVNTGAHSIRLPECSRALSVVITLSPNSSLIITPWAMPNGGASNANGHTGSTFALRLNPNFSESGCLRDLGQLYKEGIFSDVCFVVSGTRFRVHRTILGARSEVFAKQFQADMKDSAAGAEILVPDCSAPAFDCLMWFIYTEKPWRAGHVAVEHAVEVLGLAEKYLLPVLKRMCETFLCGHLSVENVASLISEADVYSCTALKQAAETFLLRHWDEVPNESLDVLSRPLWASIVSLSLKSSKP